MLGQSYPELQEVIRGERRTIDLSGLGKQVFRFHSKVVCVGTREHVSPRAQNCRFFSPIIGLGVHTSDKIFQQGHTKKEEEIARILPRFAVILPEYQMLPKLGTLFFCFFFGGGHSATSPPPPFSYTYVAIWGYWATEAQEMFSGEWPCSVYVCVCVCLWGGGGHVSITNKSYLTGVLDKSTQWWPLYHQPCEGKTHSYHTLYLKETSGRFVDFPIWKYIN